MWAFMFLQSSDSEYKLCEIQVWLWSQNKSSIFKNDSTYLYMKVQIFTLY